MAHSVPRLQSPCTTTAEELLPEEHNFPVHRVDFITASNPDTSKMVAALCQRRGR